MKVEQQITTNGLDVNGKSREAFLVELYREHTITHRQLGDALGLERNEKDGVLKRHGVGLDVSVEEIKPEAGLLQGVKEQYQAAIANVRTRKLTQDLERKSGEETQQTQQLETGPEQKHETAQDD
jgi:hypothetical protein